MVPVHPPKPIVTAMITRLESNPVSSTLPADVNNPFAR
jgi:hypothetical protein